MAADPYNKKWRTSTAATTGTHEATAATKRIKQSLSVRSQLSNADWITSHRPTLAATFERTQTGSTHPEAATPQRRPEAARTSHEASGHREHRMFSFFRQPPKQ
jgi:hypothetical protein